MKYKSILGRSPEVNFDQAILDGFAPDGGLYVPEFLPKISHAQLENWKGLDYLSLAQEVLSLFVPTEIMHASELKKLLKTCFQDFGDDSIIPLYPLKSHEKTYVLELFHGPTLSFKDIGLAFLVNLVDFLLKRKKEKLTIIVATTGDTGPAAAHYSAHKKNLETWVLYPQSMITQEQEIQMTSINASNVHPVAVRNCPDGGDDLDRVIATLFSDTTFKKRLKLSSVNSINWGRIMMQTVHYFYSYLRVCEEVGEAISMAVPSGAFGNLCAGSIARMMGLPVHTFIIANNRNACLHRIFENGVFSLKKIHETYSSAIDILIPHNFWRFFYYAVGMNSDLVSKFMKEFEKSGEVVFPPEIRSKISKGFLSKSISDEETLKTIRDTFEEEGYLIDPHGAVALAATRQIKKILKDEKVICFVTAHPAKFPKVIKQALSNNQAPALATQATHHSLEIARTKCQKLRICDHEHLEEALRNAMEYNWKEK